MYNKIVKDLMIPVNKYPAIHEDANMLEAIKSLQDYSEKSNQVHPYRAVLVINSQHKVIGKIGHLGFLKALEPKYESVFDMDKLARASLSAGFLDSMIDHFSLWNDELDNICQSAKRTLAKEIMSPVEEHIEENESLGHAIHKLIMWKTMSLLVTRGNEIVGILRLSDVFNEIENYLLNECIKSKGE